MLPKIPRYYLSDFYSFCNSGLQKGVGHTGFAKSCWRGLTHHPQGLNTMVINIFICDVCVVQGEIAKPHPSYLAPFIPPPARIMFSGTCPCLRNIFSSISLSTSRLTCSFHRFRKLKPAVWSLTHRDTSDMSTFIDFCAHSDSSHAHGYKPKDSLPHYQLIPPPNKRLTFPVLARPSLCWSMA